MKIKELIKYRTYWMGIAILGVMLCHISTSFTGVLQSIATYGYGGVDIFIFASGVGNYYSYLKDSSPLVFIKRKIRRLAPAYIPFIIMWIVINLKRGSIYPNAIIGNLFGYQRVVSNGGEFNWFLAGILLCYFLTPYLASFINEKSIKGNILLIVFFVIVSTSFWGDARMIVFITRLPIYIIGMVTAKYSEVRLESKHYIFGFILFLLGIILLFIFFRYYDQWLWNKGLSWYPFILITPFLCLMISTIINRLENNKILYKLFKYPIKVLEKIGRCSFEIFLIHIFIIGEASILISKFQIENTLFINVCACVFSILLSFVYQRIIKLLLSNK